MRKKLYTALGALPGPAIFLAVWKAVSLPGVLRPGLIPSPESTLAAVAALLTGANGWGDLLATLWRVLAGVGVSIAIGVPAGFLLGQSRLMRRMSGGVLDFFRSLPPVALYPVAVLFFSPEGFATYSLVIFGCSTVIIMNTSAGVANMPRSRRDMLRALGASGWQNFRYVVFYETLPQVAVGVRVALSLSVIIVVVSEMFIGFGGTAASLGLGVRLADAMTAFRPPQTYACILLIGIIGFALNRAAVAAEKAAVHWIN